MRRLISCPRRLRVNVAIVWRTFNIQTESPSDGGRTRLVETLVRSVVTCSVWRPVVWCPIFSSSLLADKGRFNSSLTSKPQALTLRPFTSIASRLHERLVQEKALVRPAVQSKNDLRGIPPVLCRLNSFLPDDDGDQPTVVNTLYFHFRVHHCSSLDNHGRLRFFRREHEENETVPDDFNWTEMCIVFD